MALEPTVDEATLDRAARMFRAAGDVARLRLLALLWKGERTVTELAAATDAQMSTVSQQLRFLRMEQLVRARRDKKFIYYALADDHVRTLVANVLEHAGGDLCCTDDELETKE
jgi:ArsR family transcriptional regulator, lead/cadmium/zinc/bismuth-responsive transcriptional repressor